MKKYNPSKIEPKWQKIWEEKGLYKTDLKKGPKFYCLVMFSYPSADKLHVGHWYNFGPTDSYARFKKMQGYNVFEPMGFDAFGLPAENYAIQTGVHPKKSTYENIKYMEKQLKQIGAMYDFTKEIITSDPKYYKWTQWLFLQLYKNGLAYKKKAKVNFCPSCQTVLANEQVIDGRCERCETEVIQKDLEQWFFKITKYAERLVRNLKKLDWPEESKKRQKDWIGKSEGTVIRFEICDRDREYIDVFTTRPDTLFGATYIVLAPEKWQELKSKIKNQNAKLKSKIQNYIKSTEKKTYFERQFIKEKTGVFTGIYAINPATGKQIPIWISDYVLPEYGTGAIMCVPAHDQRDFEFAKKFNLPIRQVIKKLKTKNEKVKTTIQNSKLEEAYEGEGTMINSGKFNGLDSEKGKEEIIKWLAKKGLAKKTTTYKLRDWLVSRQRYWGAPIPIIYCRKCWEVKTKNEKLKTDFTMIDGKEYAIILIPEEQLPVLLPEKVDFKPTGASPLKSCSEFVNTKCPKCGRPAKRETDTLDTFVCSSWYFLRYLSPNLKNKPFDRLRVKKWLPVDMYIGGKEHVTMHLIYARFMTKVLNDLGYLPFNEPFKKLRHQGVITKNGIKMSKSKGNVVIPDEFIKKYGSDTLRIYLMFMGPYDQGGDWSDRGIVGVYRFLNKIWNLVNNMGRIRANWRIPKDNEIKRKLHQTIKKVARDLENLRFNTAVAALMEFLNQFSIQAPEGSFQFSREVLETYLKLLAPFAPHLCEELWNKLGHKNSIFEEKWPKYDPKLIKEEKITIVIQVNGKLRDKIEVDSATPEVEIKKLAQNTPKIKKWLSGEKVQKAIYVRDKLINFVI